MKLVDEITRLFSNEDFFQKILPLLAKNDLENENNIVLQGLTGGSKNTFVYTLFKELLNKSTKNNYPTKILYICGTTKESEEAYLDIKTLSKDNTCICYFPDWEIIEYEHISPFPDIIHQRITVLHKLLVGEPILVVTSIKALMRNLVPKEIFKNEYINLKINEEFELEKLIKLLVELGYERVDKVVEAGTFALKGGILDVFPSAFENPARIEFWGDTIDSMRIFNPINQKSIDKNIKEIEILPQRELIFTDDHVLRAVDIIESRFSEDYRDYKKIIDELSEKNHFQGIEQYQAFFYSPATLLEYFDDNLIVLFNEKTNLYKFSQKIKFETNALYNQSHKLKNVRPNPDEIFTYLDILESIVDKNIDLTSLIKLDENEDGTVINTNINSSPNFMSDYNYFREFVEENKDKAIIIFSSYDGQAIRLQNAISDLDPITEYTLMKDYKKLKKTNPSPTKVKTIKQVEKSKVYIGIGDYSKGFGTSSFVFIHDRELRGNKQTYSKKIRKVNSAPIETFLDLKKNDYVVHINYGIGKFIGIERMKILDKESDFIHIQYADDETLYVPIEQLNLVQKYIGASTRSVRLDKIGSKSWERTKKRVEKSIEEMAEELLKLYSVRQKLKGYAFSKDSEYQLQFESEFKYEETPDQFKAIEEVKKDMEIPKPMDRLICGDVGYGKTEVAIRSAFKCVMDGKQVAVLVPTTILCEQHYITFKERFKNYPVVIEMLSRFKTKSEQKNIIKSMNEGKIDIIIGTHRLISKDISFKNLGLVVVDEEQRFGVKHKEKLKKLRTLVDVITMSATPIPRTLHMSLTNIRDMSIINTPPENRLPIQTYSMEFNENIIKDAILKEINRGGQVYFVYNRVKTIKSFAQFLMENVSSVRIAVAHGQMEENELEKIIMDFIKRKYDILVCTTIIENGIDIPNVNTILIDRADTFGLSQLYQLRGRVGREDRQAYCYLFYPADRALSEVAQKRLSIINEFTDLGSGFKIAMRDMEMRGAGNVLGAEQSGDIVAVGYEMYCKLLDEAIKKITIGEESIVYEVYIDLNYDGYIPDNYIADEKQKMEIYKRIAGCLSQDDVNILYDELLDRFGELPKIVKELMKISELKAISNNLKIPRIQEKITNIDKWVEIEFNKFSRIDPMKILPLMKSSDNNLMFINQHTPDRLYLKICDFNLEQKVNYIKKTLNNLRN